MVIIKTMDKSTLKSKINYQSNYQSDINTDLSNIAIQTMHEIKYDDVAKPLTYIKSLKVIVNLLKVMTCSNK